MSYKERTVGGGPAKQLGQDWTNLLSQFITSGSFGGSTASQQFGGADPGGSAQNVFSLLNSIISNPAADKSVQDLIARDTERGRNALRESFGGGTSMGSPAAFAQALFESEQAPRTAVAMDEMAKGRLGALLPLFGFANQTAGLGIPQAQSTLEPPAWLQAVNTGLDVAGTVAPFFTGGIPIPGLGGKGTGAQRVPTRTGASDLAGVGKEFAMTSTPSFGAGSSYIDSIVAPPRSFAQQLYS